MFLDVCLYRIQNSTGVIKMDRGWRTTHIPKIDEPEGSWWGGDPSEDDTL